MTNKTEKWKDVKGFPNYKISSKGRVKSLNHNKQKILKLFYSNGYLAVNLWKNNKSKTIRIHLLVTITFLNHKPSRKFVVDHINNIKTDNRLENLQVITNRENSSKDKKGFSSKYVGVCWQCNKWIARIRVNGKKLHLGYFENEYDAHLRYQEELKKIK